MRLLPFALHGTAGRTTHLGALVDGDADVGTIVDLTAAARCVAAAGGATARGAARLAAADVVAFLEGGEATGDAARQALAQAVEHGWEVDPLGACVRYDVAGVTRLPAVPEPPLLRDFMAFEQHLRNIYPGLGREIPPQWYEFPAYYKGNPAATGAHGDDVAMPSYADTLDLEFEVAAVIGREAVDVPAERARNHIAGWCIWNDFSAREMQARELAVGLGPAKGKDFISAHVLGPVLVTADEVPDPYALAMQARVDGEVWTQGTTGDMHWSFEQMIEHASRSERLRVGEVIGSGTVGGGSGAEQGRWLEAGAQVELEVERLGVLRNRVVAHGT